MNCTPVLIFTYTRLDSLKKVFNNLKKCDYSKETDVIVFSDGWKDDDTHIKVNSVREYLDFQKNEKSFKSLSIIKSDINLGVDQSIINGVSKIIKDYERVIVLEDDILVSNTFLKYMNAALDYYQNEKRVFSIGAYCPNIPINSDNVFFFKRIESWGWGIWKDRWETIDWSLKDFDKLISSEKEIKKFNKGGNDLFEMLVANKEAWDLRACYTMYKNDVSTVYPPKSLVKNIGFDGDGTHFKQITHKYDVDLINDFLPKNIPFTENKRIEKNMYKFYSMPNIKYFLKRIKKCLTK